METNQEPSLEEVTINRYIHRTKWPRFIALSAAFHIALFLFPNFLSRQHQYKNIPKTSIRVTLYQEPIAFNPPISFSPETQYTEQTPEQIRSESIPVKNILLETGEKGLEERLRSFYEAYVRPISESVLVPIGRFIYGGFNRINDRLLYKERKDRFYQEFIEDLEEDQERIIQQLKGIAQQVEEIAKGIEELKYRKLCAEVKDVLLNQRDISEFYTSRYKPKERNEISYNEFFKAYFDVYLNLNGRYRSILPILKRNPLEIMDLHGEINKDGILRIVRLEPKQGFVDENGKVLKHYEELFENMPKNLPPPPGNTPYVLYYVVLNPALRHQKVGSETSLVSK